jgi:hypothetical protein
LVLPWYPFTYFGENGGIVKVACLGWGSLVWNPGELKVEPAWKTNGPLLPIEFARLSENGRLTLVIVPSPYQLVQSLWSLFTAASLDDARVSLKDREGAGRIEDIHYWENGAQQPAECIRGVVAAWASNEGLDAVVWTGLGPKGFGDNRRRGPTLGEAIGYLGALKVGSEPRRLAQEYVERAPAQIATPFRAAFAADLGWKSIS